MKYLAWIVFAGLLGIFLFPVAYIVSLIYFKGQMSLFLFPFFIFTVVIIFVHGMIWIVMHLFYKAKDEKDEEEDDDDDSWSKK